MSKHVRKTPLTDAVLERGKRTVKSIVQLEREQQEREWKQQQRELMVKMVDDWEKK